jgi:putative solute:sodium symporter small subunit
MDRSSLPSVFSLFTAALRKALPPILGRKYYEKARQYNVSVPQRLAISAADRTRQRRRGDAATISPLRLQPDAGRDTGGSASMQQKSNDELHWRRTTNLMLTHLGIWLFFGYIIHMFVNVLNQYTIPVLQFPLGFYMAAQGSLIVFVVMLFVFAKQQDNIDREHGVAEDD